MKRLIFAAFLIAAPLGGCSTNPLANTATTVAGGGSVTQANPEIMANAKKALTAAHIAYNALSQSILLATQNGVLHGSNAAQVKIYYGKAGDALVVADKADDIADAKGIMKAVASANSFIASAKNLTGSN